MTLSNMHPIPTLSLRKDIWTHFPVCLVKIPTKDGNERWAVQWHQKNLTDWSQDIPGYETITKLRLFHALMACPNWKVEKPETSGDLCILTMISPDTNSVPALFADTKAIRKLDDVKDYFPVCWKRKDNMYSFDIHKARLKALARVHHQSESDLYQKTVSELLPILSQFGNLTKTEMGLCTLIRT
jgi:hypothetical protein